MFLILDVTSANGSSLGAAARMVFSRQGGSIGRRPGNDWVRPDPHVSGPHARIRAMGGTYFLEDNESGNGVLVNGNRIHAGEPFPLKEGDVVFIDPFEIAVRLSPTAPDVPAPVSAPAISPPTAAPIPQAPQPWSTGGLDDLINPGTQEFNPLLDAPAATPAQQIPTGLDLLGKPVLHDALTLATPPPPRQPAARPAPPPSGGGGIPSNWDLSDLDPGA